MTKEKIYRRLAEHLDRLPHGFPPSETGADLRLLERLFTPEEANLAVHLTLEREKAQVIAERTGLPQSQVQSHLDQMAQKGLILSLKASDGSLRYQGVEFGLIMDYQANNLSQELLEDAHAYWSSIEERPPLETIPGLRTIPVGESIEHYPEVLAYEQVSELVKANTQFAVANCFCRSHAKATGGGCDAPVESCLIFDDWADFVVRTGRGRSLNRSEMLDLIKKADAANLVLQPSNAREIKTICCCCGCCCGILASYKSHPRPADYVVSAFIAQLDADACQGCWTCLDRCQMDALVANESHVILKSDRCIGCGLCVTTCPNEALSLIRKLESARTRVPATWDDTWQIILQDQERQRAMVESGKR